MVRPERFFGPVARVNFVFFWKMKRKQNMEESKEAKQFFSSLLKRHDTVTEKQNMDTKWMEECVCVYVWIVYRRENSKSGC